MIQLTEDEILEDVENATKQHKFKEIEEIEKFIKICKESLSK